MAPYNSVDVAKYIIFKANERGQTLNMTKLQKLLYIAYGIYFAVKGKNLTYEAPEAWISGPVFSAAGNELVKFKFDEHGKLAPALIKEDGVKAVAKDHDVDSLIDSVFTTFRGWTSGQLSKWSQSEGSPWEKTKDSADFKWKQAIPDEYIKEYFIKMV